MLTLVKRVAELSRSMRTFLFIFLLVLAVLVLPSMKALAWWTRFILTVTLPLALVWKPSLLSTAPWSRNNQMRSS